MRTLPFKVVAAKSLASVEAFAEDSISCVVVHASGYKASVSVQAVQAVHGHGAYGFLELLQKIMCLRFP